MRIVLGTGPDSYRDEPALVFAFYSNAKTFKQQKLLVSKELLVLGAGIEPALALGRTGF